MKSGKTKDHPVRTLFRWLLALAYGYAGWAHLARPAPFLALLAQAELRGRTGRAGASAADALDLAERLGFRPVGWERVYRLMAGVPG